MNKPLTAIGVATILAIGGYFAYSQFDADSDQRHQPTIISQTKPQNQAGSLSDLGIAVVAPGAYGQEANGCALGFDTLKQQGFNVINYYDHSKRHQRFAGTDDNRLQQINRAINNPDVDVIMALRGGYGTSRLLSSLDFEKIAKSGKIFVGHSDITAIHMALLKHGAISFAGPMVCSDYAQTTLNASAMRHFTNVLTKPQINIDWTSSGNPDIDVSGTLWGGNLTMLASLTGTQWIPDIDGGILFVEDIHEHPFHLERMLIQLDEAGILRKQKALVLGRFTEYQTSSFDNGYDLSAMVAWLRKRLRIPVITGLPFGHVRDKVTLPIGANGHLTSRNGNVSLTVEGYPVLVRK